MSEHSSSERGSGRYLYTEIDYPHPYSAPDDSRLLITNWFDFGCRTTPLEVR